MGEPNNTFNDPRLKLAKDLEHESSNMSMDASASIKRINLMFFTTFIAKIIVSPQGNVNFALGLMALPHKIDAHEHQGFSKTTQIPHFSFQALIIQNQKYA